MSTGSISDASLKYFEEKRIRALLDEAMRDVLMAMPDDPLAFLEKAFEKPTPLRIALSGLPGSGKGTQSARLVERYGVCHINTGDILKAAADAAADGNTDADDAMVQIGQYVRDGALVPDELLVSMVVSRIRNAEEQSAGWILDDFPRTRAQAIYLQSAGISPQRFIFLDVPDDVCAARYLASAPQGAEDHASNTDTASGPAALKSRLDYFAARKEELLDCYWPFYVRVDGNREADDVFAEICAQCDAVDIAK